MQIYNAKGLAEMRRSQKVGPKLRLQFFTQAEGSDAGGSVLTGPLYEEGLRGVYIDPIVLYISIKIPPIQT